MSLDMQTLVSGEVYRFLLVFCRIGAACMLLPGFGEAWVSPRLRLGFSLMLSFMIYGAVREQVPSETPVGAWMLADIAAEISVGLFIGVLARIMAASLLVAGNVAAQAGGLSNVFVQGAVSPDGTAIVGNFLGIAGLAFMFSSGLDHMMISGLLDSYSLIEPVGSGGYRLPVEDMARIVTHTVSGSFMVGIKMSAPFLVYNTMLTAGLGLANRFMPQLQVFFLSTPLAVSGLLFLLGLLIPALLGLFETAFSGIFTDVVP
jgi:flagellar biosynthetic protein FliR